MLKKITLPIIALCTLAMVAYAKKNQTEELPLNTLNDSINYALGVLNGDQIQMYYIKGDVSPIVINEFFDALQNGYNGTVEQLSESAKIGKNIGISIKNAKENGLANNPAWTINQKIFFQGLVNGMYQDSSMITAAEALNYFQTEYQASALSNDSIVKGKPILGTCPNKVKHVKLTSKNDSLNYTFGLINGFELAQQVLLEDADGKLKTEFIQYVNKGLKSQIMNPSIVEIGQEIGKELKKQEETGLFGLSNLTTDFARIKQGLLHGITGNTKIWDSQAASEYVQNTMTDIKYGKLKRDAEQFLAENQSREGVITTESGLQYEVITLGTGIKPTIHDEVKVHYHGTMIDGTVFDSSVERGEPITFALTQVIPGWTEGLQLMPVGSKFIFYIPYNLGYGEQQVGPIAPYSTLIFEVELLDCIEVELLDYIE
jgi:FKBP-type peptidyl-prolyl cis-trans isomerase FklB